MSQAQTQKNIYLDKLPAMPDVAQRFIALTVKTNIDTAKIQLLQNDYPEFFQSLLDIINSEYFRLSVQAKDINHAIELAGAEKILHIMLCMVIYITFNRADIRGLDLQEFWQDSLRRAMSARMIAESIELDPDHCFLSGFMQDIGFLLLFVLQPGKAALWAEFRKREPEARYNMEQNIFSMSHDQAMALLCEKWQFDVAICQPIIQHHSDLNNISSKKDKTLSQLLYCADWLASVYTANDKSFVIERCHSLLKQHFSIESHRSEGFLSALPYEVELIAETLKVDIKHHVKYSQVLYEANKQLSEDNVNFQELTLRLDQALEERDKLAEELNDELSLAREIQKSLLPPDMGENYPLVGINISARDLSGDFYDYFTLDDGRIYFNLGDVSGKGVNAALLMAKTSSLFRCLGKRIDDPEELLSVINAELCETSIHGMFVTMVAGIYEPDTGKLIFVNAGNPPALLLSVDGLAREMDAKGPPLGVLREAVFPGVELQLNDDCLYMFSDGVTEGYMEDGSMMEISGLFKTIVNLDESLSAHDRLIAITNKLKESSSAIRDDITLLLLTGSDQ